MALQSVCPAAARTDAHLFSPPSHAMWEKILISHHPPSWCLSSAAWGHPLSQGQLCHCSAGNPGSKPAQSHPPACSADSFPHQEILWVTQQVFLFQLICSQCCFIFQNHFLCSEEEGIAHESFFEGGVSNFPFTHMKMQILSKWHWTLESSNIFVWQICSQSLKPCPASELCWSALCCQHQHLPAGWSLSGSGGLALAGAWVGSGQLGWPCLALGH